MCMFRPPPLLTTMVTRDGTIWRMRQNIRKEIKLKRLHAFAADRFLMANSVGAAKFWRSVMQFCVATTETWREPTLEEYVQDNRGRSRR